MKPVHLRHRRIWAALAGAAWLLLSGVDGQCAPADAAEEYAVKGAMLLNIARMVDWPAEKAADSFVIGILAAPSVGTELERVVKDKAVGGKVVVVKRLKSLAAATDCHLVYVAGNDGKAAEKEAATLAKAAVLTVGESERFAECGGVIGLVVRDKRLQMEVNLKAAQRSRLQISSRILRLATIVEGGG